MMKTLEQIQMWEAIRSNMQKCMKTCRKCQLHKCTHKKCGLLPAKEAEESIPCNCGGADLAGLWAVKAKNGTFTFRALTMIDPDTGWFEAAKVVDAAVTIIDEVFNHEWLS